MMLRVIFGLMILSLSDVALGQIESIRKEVDKIIEHDTQITLDKIPGFTIAIIDGDSIFNLEYGVAAAGTDFTLSDESIFEIGSVTKVFMAALVEDLVDKGFLQYEDLVNSYIPEKYRNPRMSKLTLSDLIYHQSGFPKLPHFFGRKEKEVQNPYGYYSKDDLLKFYSEFLPSQEEKSYNYSHCNYGLLEILVESKMEQSIDQLFKDHIFDVIGMENSFLELSEYHLNAITQGYDRAGRMVSPWTYNSFKASEGMKSSSRDLARFLQANMGILESSLLPSLTKTLERQQVTNFNKHVFIAKAWHIVDQGKHYAIATHSGFTSGHHCLIAFVKETKTGVVVLSNSSVGTEDLGFLILRMINHNWKRKA